MTTKDASLGQNDTKLLYWILKLKAIIRKSDFFLLNFISKRSLICQESNSENSRCESIFQFARVGPPENTGAISFRSCLQNLAWRLERRGTERTLARLTVCVHSSC